MRKSIRMVVLAAGKGTRFKLNVPKPLAPLLGKKMIDFCLQQFNLFCQKHSLDGSISIITGHKRELVEDYVKKCDSKVQFVVQEEQKGTGHALMTYFADSSDAKKYDYTLIMCADTPLITSEDLSQIFHQFSHSSYLDGVVASFTTDNPFGYGRIVKHESQGFKIIEEKDASLEERKIQEVNSGLYIFKTAFLSSALSQLTNKNQAGEYYLTDVFQWGRALQAVNFKQAENFLGVNDLKQLEHVSHILRARKVEHLREQGVFFLDSKTVTLDWDVEVGEGTVIHPQVSLLTGTKIAKNCVLEPGVIIKNCHLSDDVEIKAYSYLEDATVKADASIGPFARIRPGSEIGAEAKVGNFVEVKKAKLGQGAKVSHLSYVGDAEIGDETNIGCGFITCNYDGANKHFTKIGKNSFIGSDVQMVAPIEIGDNAFVAAGSTITKSVPEGGFAIARGTQITKENMAKKFLKSKK